MTEPSKDYESRSLLNDKQEVIHNYSNRNSCKTCLIAGTLILVIGFGLGFGLYYGLKSKGCSDQEYCDQFKCSETSALGNFCSNPESKLGEYNEYAISTDSEPCAAFGQDIISKGGNAVDSIISVLLCMGVTIPESTGLGGGSLITVYNANDSRAYAIDAREQAPRGAWAAMYNDTGHVNSVQGPLAIAVPGELFGYRHIYEKFGSGRLDPSEQKVNWTDLFQGAIGLCNDGFAVSEHLSTALEQKKEQIMAHKELRDVYVNPKTKDTYKEGEILVQKTLGQTLKNLSEAVDPIKHWKEEIAPKIVKDIKDSAQSWLKPNVTPIIDLEDFRNYTIKETVAITQHFQLKNITLHTFPLPCSGNILSFIMNVMQRFIDLYPSALTSTEKAILFYHRLIETYKFGYAQRQHLGDPDFEEKAKIVVQLLSNETFVENVKNKIDDKTTYKSSSGHYDDNQEFLHDDHGTAHVSIVDKEGNAVAVTTTVNSYFGSKVMSPSTGLLMNNEMDDFNTGAVNDYGIPPSDSNIIEPRKRPLSSMCPTVFTDGSGLRLVIGGSGGPKITTTVASVAIRNLWFGEDIRRAIEAQRVHHQLYPDQITYEKCFPENILNELESKGHKLQRLKDGERGAIIMAISKNDGKLYANSDYRKGGTVAGR